MPMNLRATFLLGAALVLVACGQQASIASPTAKPEPSPELEEHYRLMAEQAKFQKRFMAVLPSLRIDRLYYLDPMANPAYAPGKEFHNVAVAMESNSPLPEKVNQELLVSLRKIIESTPEYAAACCDPHHAAVLTNGAERFDVVVCFECGNYRIFSPDGNWLLAGSFDVGGEELWDAAFAEGGLTRPARDASH